MPDNRTNRRQLVRRPLKMPVAYTIDEKKKSLAGYYFGWTANVHMQGMCIKTKPNQIPAAGAAVTIMVMSQANDRLEVSDVSVKITGEVAWVNREAEKFGVSFPNGNSQ
jgi:hypothetical protein